MDSIPLSPRVGAPCIWCEVGYLSFSLLSLIGFPMLWIGVSIVYC
jgi:ABC-type phosphate transport system auxiliary subunit